MPKSIPDTVTPTLLTGTRFTIRNDNGYVDEFNNANTVEVVDNPTYSVTLYKTNGDNTLLIVIDKSTGFTPTNNSIIQVSIDPLKIEFT